MSWLLLALLLATGAIWFRQRRNFLRHLRRVEEIVDDVSAGRAARNFVFHKAVDFHGLAWRLEHLSDEHELLKKQVEERKFNLDAILAGMAEGVLVTSETHVVQMVNASFCRMFDVAADPLGQTILGATRNAAVDALIAETLARGAIESREITAQQPHGEVHFFNANAVPLKTAQGARAGAVAVFHDISRLRQLEQVRREFVANVSHELRTPLSIFQGYLETLLDHPEMEPAAVAEALAIMRKHSGRLNALVDDLLSLARLEARQEILSPGDLVLEPFLAALLREWEKKFALKKVTAALQIPVALRVRADPVRLEQIVSNLLDNALKFTREGGTITLAAEARDTFAEVRVCDDGIGIPPADLPHIFERFYRVEKGRGRDTGGTGLGLSIVKHLVGSHSGSVRAESNFGRGTAIIFTLPLA